MFTFVYISKCILLITCINLLQSKHQLSLEPRITNVQQHWKEKKIILILQKNANFFNFRPRIQGQAVQILEK